MADDLSQAWTALDQGRPGVALEAAQRALAAHQDSAEALRLRAAVLRTQDGCGELAELDCARLVSLGAAPEPAVWAAVEGTRVDEQTAAEAASHKFPNTLPSADVIAWHFAQYSSEAAGCPAAAADRTDEAITAEMRGKSSDERNRLKFERAVARRRALNTAGAWADLKSLMAFAKSGRLPREILGAYWNELGTFRLARGDTEAAMAALDNAREAEPQCVNTLLKIAEIDSDHRRGYVSHATSVAPGHSDVAVAQATVALAEGDEAGARGLLGAVLADEPAHVGAACSLARLEPLGAAVRVLEAAAPRWDCARIGVTLTELGLAALQRGEEDLAPLGETLAAQAEDHPESSTPLVLRGLVTGSVEALQAAAAIDPSSFLLCDVWRAAALRSPDAARAALRFADEAGVDAARTAALLRSAIALRVVASLVLTALTTDYGVGVPVLEPSDEAKEAEEGSGSGSETDDSEADNQAQPPPAPVPALQIPPRNAQEAEAHVQPSNEPPQDDFDTALELIKSDQPTAGIMMLTRILRVVETEEDAANVLVVRAAGRMRQGNIIEACADLVRAGEPADSPQWADAVRRAVALSDEGSSNAGKYSGSPCYESCQTLLEVFADQPRPAQWPAVADDAEPIANASEPHELLHNLALAAHRCDGRALIELLTSHVETVGPMLPSAGGAWLFAVMWLSNPDAAKATGELVDELAPQMLEMIPDAPVAWATLVYALAMRPSGVDRAALAAATAAMEQLPRFDPEARLWHVLRCHEAASTSSPEELRACAERFVAAHPGTDLGRVLLARAHTALGDEAAARAALADSVSAMGVAALAHIDLAAGRAPAPVSDAQLAADSTGVLAELRLRLSAAEGDARVSEARRLLAEHPFRPRVAVELARLLLAAGKRDEALGAAESLLSAERASSMDGQPDVQAELAALLSELVPGSAAMNAPTPEEIALREASAAVMQASMTSDADPAASAEAFQVRADVYAAQGQAELAAADLVAAVAFQNTPERRARVSNWLQRVSMDEASLSVVRRALDLHAERLPGNVRAHVRSFLDGEASPEAQATALYQEGRKLMTAGLPVAAFYRFSHAIDLAPDLSNVRADALMGRVRAAGRVGNQAERELRDMCLCFEDLRFRRDADALLMRGGAHFRTGHYSESAMDYGIARLCLQRSPPDLPRDRMAELEQSLEGRHKDALRVAGETRSAKMFEAREKPIVPPPAVVRLQWSRLQVGLPTFAGVTQSSVQEIDEALHSAPVESEERLRLLLRRAEMQARAGDLQGAISSIEGETQTLDHVYGDSALTADGTAFMTMLFSHVHQRSSMQQRIMGALQHNPGCAFALAQAALVAPNDRVGEFVGRFENVGGSLYDVHCIMAYRLTDNSQHEDAAARARLALEVDPNGPYAALLLAMALSCVTPDVDEALTATRAALELSPEPDAALRVFARHVYVKSQRYKTSQQVLVTIGNEVLSASGAGVGAHLCKGCGLLHQEFSRQIHDEGGEAFQRSPVVDEALTELRRSIAVAPDESDIYLMLAEALQSMQLREEALEAYESALPRTPSQDEACGIVSTMIELRTMLVLDDFQNDWAADYGKGKKDEAELAPMPEQDDGAPVASPGGARSGHSAPSSPVKRGSPQHGKGGSPQGAGAGAELPDEDVDGTALLVEASELSADCVAAYAEGDVEGALQRCEAAMRVIEPVGKERAVERLRATLFHNRAMIYMNRGEICRALVDATQSLRHDRTRPDTFIHRGQLHQLLDHHGECLADMTAAWLVECETAERENRAPNKQQQQELEQVCNDAAAQKNRTISDRVRQARVDNQLRDEDPDIGYRIIDPAEVRSVLESFNGTQPQRLPPTDGLTLGGELDSRIAAETSAQDRAVLRFQRALLLRDAGAYKESWDEIAGIAEGDLPAEMLPAYLNVRGTYVMCDHQTASRCIFERAHSLNPDCMDTMLKLAKAQGLSSRVDQMNDTIQRTLGFTDNVLCAGAALVLARVNWVVLSQSDVALTMARHAMEQDPACIEAKRLAADLEMDKGNFDVADALFREAAEADPFPALTHSRWGDALSRRQPLTADLVADASEHWDTAAVMWEETPVPLINKATMLQGLAQSLEDVAVCEQLLRQALQRDPESQTAHFHLAKCLRLKGDRKGALEMARKALELCRPTSIFVHYCHLFVSLQAHQHADALMAANGDELAAADYAYEPDLSQDTTEEDRAAAARLGQMGEGTTGADVGAAITRVHDLVNGGNPGEAAHVAQQVVAACREEGAPDAVREQLGTALFASARANLAHKNGRQALKDAQECFLLHRNAEVLELRCDAFGLCGRTDEAIYDAATLFEIDGTRSRSDFFDRLVRAEAERSMLQLVEARPMPPDPQCSVNAREFVRNFDAEAVGAPEDDGSVPDSQLEAGVAAGDAAARLLLMRRRMFAGAVKEGHDLAEEAVAQGVTYPGEAGCAFWNTVGTFRIQMGRRNDARDAFRLALEAAPRCANTLCKIAVSFADDSLSHHGQPRPPPGLGRAMDALAAAERVLGGATPSVLYWRAVVHASNNNWDLATADTDRLVEMAPTWWPGLLYSSSCQMNSGRLETARELIDRAIEACPATEPFALESRARCHLDTLSREELDADLAEMERRDPTNANIFQIRGEFHLRSAESNDDLEHAGREFQRCIELEPKLVSGHLGAATVRARLGDFDGVERAVQKGLDAMTVHNQCSDIEALLFKSILARAQKMAVANMNGDDYGPAAVNEVFESA